MTTVHSAFSLGRVFATPALRAACELEWIHDCLVRHARRDWGDVSPEDAEANDRAVVLGGRIFSAYPLQRVNMERSFWIVTEPDRVLTTCLLPSEYELERAARSNDAVRSINRLAMRGRSS